MLQLTIDMGHINWASVQFHQTSRARYWTLPYAEEQIEGDSIFAHARRKPVYSAAISDETSMCLDPKWIPLRIRPVHGVEVGNVTIAFCRTGSILPLAR